MNKKAAVIVPYFGKYPEWIDLYFHSCGMNKNIDFYFFTDCEEPKIHATNLYFKQISFIDYCARIGEKLQIDFQPESPYRLCDLRPFYGKIYQDILKIYDFWGWGDVDVIWGDIPNFYTDELLAEYDVFSTHADRLSGHFTLIKNTEYYCNLCFQIPNWKNKLINEKHLALDETDFSHLIYPQSKIIKKFYSKIIRRIFNWRNAWVVYYKLLPIMNVVLGIKKRRLYFKEQHTTPILYPDGLSFKHDSDSWTYKNGKIYNNKNNKEYIYLHFMIFKKNGFRNDHFWNKDYYHIEDKINENPEVLINKKGFFLK